MGETPILCGQYGSGKSSLLMAILGFERYPVKQGRINFLTLEKEMELAYRNRVRAGEALTMRGENREAEGSAGKSRRLRGNNKQISYLDRPRRYSGGTATSCPYWL